MTSHVSLAVVAALTVGTLHNKPAEQPTGARPQAPFTKALHTVAEAEAEGVVYPTASGVDPKARKCIDADAPAAKEITTGDFRVDMLPVKAMFVNNADPSRPSAVVRLWPKQAIPPAIGGLTVRASRLDGAADDVVWKQAELMNGVAYRPGGYLPNGRWLFVATAGPNWGCFISTKTQ
jgi:hypothetical protein